MSRTVTPLHQENAGSLGPGQFEQQSSRLLPGLFSRLNPDRRVTVLDVGPAVPETVRFFSQFRTRLHITNLYEEPLVRAQQHELDEAEMKKAFQDILRIPRGSLIDVCLFWDFLNYLTPRALCALNAALRPYVHSGTRGHGFSVLNVETPLKNRQYGIAQADMMCARPSRLEQLHYYPHSHEELNVCLDSFRIGRGWLLADGRLEMLLEAQV